jgi:hypothetical protein
MIDDSVIVKKEKYEKIQAVIDAAKCIRHWHDAMKDSSGMVVSADAVRDLWSALHDLENDQLN